MRAINKDHTPFPWHCVNYAGYINIQDGPFYGSNDIFDESKVGEHVAAANVKIIESLPEILEENATLKAQRDELLQIAVECEENFCLVTSLDKEQITYKEWLQFRDQLAGLIQKHKP